MTQPDTLSPQHIEKFLSGSSIGRRIIYYPRIDSTNRAARALALQGKAHGWVVLADKQSAGRGRLDRIWESQAGEDILASIIVYPQLPAADSFRLTMIASIAVVLAVERVCGVACGIKWPNDIFLNGKKLCGILSEGQCGSDRMQFMVIGIGLNVNSSMSDRKELAGSAISLRDATGQQHDRNALTIAILENFNRLYATADNEGEQIRSLWEKHAMMLGRKVSVHSDDAVLNGIACGIMPDGRLIVRESSGREHLIVCGDMSLKLDQ
jgi:BirA family biotin operon repressor/biotin-[acetyl-CoA-carboxylase] ligase